MRLILNSSFAVLLLISTFHFSFGFRTTTFFTEQDSLLHKAQLYLKNKDTVSAIRYGKLAFKKQQRNNDAMLFLARVYKAQNNFSLSLDYYLQLISEAKITNDDKFSSLLNWETGEVYYELELYQKSIDYFSNVDSIHLDYYQHIKLLKQTGSAYERLKKYDKALYFFRKVLDYYSENTYKKQRSGVLIILSDLCKKLNKYREAGKYELENLSIRKEFKDSVGIAVSYNNLGTIHKNLGQYAIALDNFLKSYQLKMDYKDYSGMAITCMNIGIMYQLLEEYEPSLEYLNKALALYESSNRKRDISHTCNIIAAVYYYKKNFLKAETFALKAIENAKYSNSNDLLEAGYKLLSQVYKIQGNTDAALEYYQKYSDVKDSLFLEQKIQQQELYLKSIEMENKEAQIRDLSIEKELKDLEFRKLQLEKEKSDKESEILKRDQELREISIRQKELQQEKAINLLKLKEQKYRADASDRELKLLKQQQMLKDREKQINIEKLKSSAEINQLKLSNRESELIKQKIIQAVIIGLFVILLLIILLEFKRYRLKQNASQIKLATKNMEIEQKLLRAQMNPHFIFNALNSIQSFVTLNETYEAERYLAKFSRLMRYILDNTTQTHIPIDKEIKTLELYLELEQLRFDFKFDFTIEVSDELDKELVLLPPMLIQPFVENSIIHGIVHKKSKGLIKIKFHRLEEHLICSIEDNGIGRKEAVKIKSNSHKSHKSMGMQVTKDRIALLNEKNGSNYDANIIDLIDEDGYPLGTKVELKIMYYAES